MILSAKGWVRTAKGHDVNPAELSYRTGDAFASAARGRSNDACVFLDSSGRAYAVAPHTLPSARSLGEPLTGRLRTPDGARFVGVVSGKPDARLLLASSAGFGFVAALADTLSKNRAGKAVLNVSAGADALAPIMVAETASHVAVATTSGRLLAFPLQEVPALTRGKGQKLIHIPPKAFQDDEERTVAIVAFGEKDKLIVYAGARYTTLRFKDLANYLGTRAQRGRLLPRGFQKVDRLSVD